MSLILSQVDALREIDQVWPGVGVVIIGATALGFYFDMRWRQTSDVDLVVALELDDLSDLERRSGWIRHRRREHEFVAPGGAKVDVLPVGKQSPSAGHIEWGNGDVMDLAGMDLAFRYAVEHAVLDGYRVRVAPPAVIVLLKMVSFGDRPAERERDLEDIAHRLDAYVQEDSERRWDEAFDCGEFELAPAYLLGIDVARLCASDVHDGVVNRFLLQVGDPQTSTHALMSSCGPGRWRTEKDALARRLGAFQSAMTRAANT